MAPDINSLSQSPSPLSRLSRSLFSSTSTADQDANLPYRFSPTSLATTAAANASTQSRRASSGLESPRSARVSSDQRRRSQVGLNPHLDEAIMSSPSDLQGRERRSSLGSSFSTASPSTLAGRGMIATGDPHHDRKPSLGDIHNELEQEQEAQVNRILQMIRMQKQQLEALRTQQTAVPHGENTASGNATSRLSTEESTSRSERSTSLPLRGSGSRLRNQTSSEMIGEHPSPSLPATSTHERRSSGMEAWPSLSIESSRRSSLRDENAYYQAESANLQRENQILRTRIKELEKQVQEQSTPRTE